MKMQKRRCGRSTGWTWQAVVVRRRGSATLWQRREGSGARAAARWQRVAGAWRADAALGGRSSPSSRGVSSARPGTGTSSGHPELSKSNNRTQHTASKCGIEGSISYRYKSTQALVGKARLDTLHRDIADRVSSKVPPAILPFLFRAIYCPFLPICLC